jgi:capsular polysaccharide biosynthesis protein
MRSVRDALGAPSLRNVLVAAILGALVAAVSAALVLRGDAVYQSGTTLLIDQPRVVAAPGGEGVLAKLTLLRSKYVGLLQTELVVLPVAEATNIAPGEIAGAVGAVVPVQSLLFQVTARSSSPARAQEIAAGAGEGLVEYVEREQEAADIPAGEQIILTVVSEAGPGGKVEPTVRRAISVAAAAAVLAMGLAYVAIQLVTAPQRRA